jgi:hypothetical protein
MMIDAEFKKTHVIIDKVRQGLNTDLKRLEQLIHSTIPNQKYESFDVNYFARIDAALASAKLFNKDLYDKEVFNSDLDLLKYCTQYIANTDLVLEFGVFSGRLTTWERYINNIIKCILKYSHILCYLFTVPKKRRKATWNDSYGAKIVFSRDFNKQAP